ncbi:uncharacterized protein LOC131622858 [Vicia villosa]|uniref:uncharacterized protein LOC131622858 n=1 Tax=Vicia villosa TaxID=3911 RepID=UPI00273BC31E|nr:uncharacterized protein LOC131622858 [Vicia villosa]
MRNACECGSFRGFHFKDLIHFEMLQFADDTVLICDGSWSNLWCINEILRGFKFASGLCINLCKSSIFGLNLKDAFLDAASGVLTPEIRKVLFLFLGIPVGTNHRRKATWFSFHKAPLCILEEIMSIQRNFLWGNGDELDKVAWWRNVDGFSVKISFKRLYELKAHNSIVSDRCLLELGEFSVVSSVSLVGSGDRGGF